MNKNTTLAFIAGLLAMAVIWGGYVLFSPTANPVLKTNPTIAAPEISAGNATIMPNKAPVTKEPMAKANQETESAQIEIPVADKRPEPVPDQIASNDDEDGEPMHGDYGFEHEGCWADYCPCDTSNPDYGYFDISLCRKVKMGRPISDGEYDIGAMGRDGRRILREDQEKNGPYE